MKTAITFLVCVALLLSAQAQSRFDSTFLMARKDYFVKKGLPVDYQFDNLKINEQLTLAWEYKTGVNTKNIIGGIFLTIGGGLTALGASIPTSKSPSGSLGQIFDALNNGIKGIVLVTGVVNIVVSVPLLASSSSQSQKRNAAMESAKRLYWESQLPAKEE